MDRRRREFELAISDSTVTRRRGQDSAPMVTLTTSAEFASVRAGERTLTDAIAAGNFDLTGPPDAIERMFRGDDFPAYLLGIDRS